MGGSIAATSDALGKRGGAIGCEGMVISSVRCGPR